MRYLLLADIHANFDALEAVLAAAAGTYDRLLALGDLVGYGAEPNEVVDRLRRLDPAASVRGNHDKAACGLADLTEFNPIARESIEWTVERLTAENLDYLRGLPAGPLAVGARAELCHGAPFDEDFYIFDGSDALRAIHAARHPICFFGHTHVQVAFLYSASAFEARLPAGERVTLTDRDDQSLLVNPGSVGQPRDGDPRAAFAIYDDEARTIVLQRVSYPIERAQRKILDAGLPRALAMRLALGR
ncbi:MAG TPA: metallophosphoesterase family protein [Vicinamibacterales bacterium]|nr:metallophosphoesterase family protein [Vicinamibacterales bacterium]